MRLAPIGARLPTLEDNPPLLQNVEARRHLGGKGARRSAQASAGPPEAGPQPSAGVVDSQSVKSTGVGGDQRGYDGDKKVKGRKRHILVDTEGLVLKAKVHSAKVMDHEGIKTLLQWADGQFPSLSHLWLDAGYRGEDKGKDWVEKTLGWSVDL